MKTKAKATRALKAQQKVKAMIALAKRREAEEVRREYKEQDQARRLAISCGHK
jgi:hypothetical protein